MKPEQIAIRRVMTEELFLLPTHRKFLEGLVGVSYGGPMIAGKELEELKSISRHAAAERN